MNFSLIVESQNLIDTFEDFKQSDTLNLPTPQGIPNP